VTVAAKGEDRSIVALQHERLADAGRADREKARWRAHLTALKTRLEA
jgi:hypothetical protein